MMLQKAGSRQQANGNGALIGGQAQGDDDQGLACGVRISRGHGEPFAGERGQRLNQKRHQLGRDILRRSDVASPVAVIRGQRYADGQAPRTGDRGRLCFPASASGIKLIPLTSCMC